MISSPQTFYKKIKPSSDVAKVTDCLRIVMDTPGMPVSDIMDKYFRAYWGDFKQFWLMGGEHIEWVTFALAPHNSHWFTQWVFYHHPDVMAKVKTDMIKAGWEI